LVADQRSGTATKIARGVLELDRKSVRQRDLVRAGRRTFKAVSFALPGVEVGAIVEYRWKQTEEDNRFRYLRLNFACKFPVQQVAYFISPSPHPATMSGPTPYSLRRLIARRRR
jgi:hypothetical protein